MIRILVNFNFSKITRIDYLLMGFMLLDFKYNTVILHSHHKYNKCPCIYANYWKSKIKGADLTSSTKNLVVLFLL